MSEQMNTPMLPPPSGISEWISVWRDAVTKPSEQTFSRIALSPNAKLTTALLWIFLGSLVNILATSLVQGAWMRQMMQNSDFGVNGFPGAAGNRFVTAICGAPIGAVISVVFFAAVVGVLQLLAKMFGGRGTYEQLAYATAAILAPFYLINTVLALLAAIPYVGACFGIVSLLTGLYVLVLMVMAVKGVNGFGWGQALGSCALPFLVLLCCFAVGLIALVRIMGPGISNFFNSIPTPVP